MINELELNHEDRQAKLALDLMQQQFQEFIEMKQEGLIPEAKTFEQWTGKPQ